LGRLHPRLEQPFEDNLPGLDVAGLDVVEDLVAAEWRGRHHGNRNPPIFDHHPNRTPQGAPR
jgi:hypothetical protein